MITVLVALLFARDHLMVERSPLDLTDERVELTVDYLRQHVDPAITTPLLKPRAIVIHWTGLGSLESTLRTFAPTHLSGRPELAKGGVLNVSSHFVVDRDGSIYQLLPEIFVARHTIGLNQAAIGIENVGGPNLPLTEAQLKADESLIRSLVKQFPEINYLLGHFESPRMKSTALWRELVTGYATKKEDPGQEVMRVLRKRLNDLPLQSPP